MAVRVGDLPQVELPGRAKLRLVPDGTVGTGTPGRPLAAALFVALLVLALGLPSILSALAEPPAIARAMPRAPAASSITSLDPLRAVPKGARPVSGEPVVGVAFVRCTRLWTALPDGSMARKIIEMPGISSPTFAPNARTIAFLADEGAAGQALWLAAADGSSRERVGRITTEDVPPLAQATGLTWSPTGKHLAFALVDGRYGEYEGGSVIWTLDLSSGRFEKVGSGWPAPFWVGRELVFSSWKEDVGPRFSQPLTKHQYDARTARTPGQDRAAAVVAFSWDGIYRGGVAVFRTDGPRDELVIKDPYRQKLRRVALPPDGYRFFIHTQPAISQDASTIAVDLVDRKGERDLGLLDSSSGAWTVLDYAWEPTSSPAPVVTESLEARRARSAAADLLNHWNKAPTRRRMLTPRADRNVIPFHDRWLGYSLGAATKSGTGWVVPATVYGSMKGGKGWREIAIMVSAQKGRLQAEPHPASEVAPLDTVGDVVAFTEHLLGHEVAAPVPPAGARLMRNSIWGGSYGGITTVGFTLKTSPSGTPHPKTMGFNYGDRVDFGLGCGGVNDPKPITLGSTPAMVDHSGNANQVIWPARSLKDDPTHSVTGYGISRKQVIETARAMEAAGP